ncbi:MAG: TatD family hydrolase [Actinomycetota bacterium]
MTTWVDSHCHLHLAARGPEELLARAAAAGVAWLVCPGTDAAGSEHALALAAAHPGVVFAAAGLHPHDASRWPEEGERIAALAARAVAVGECGLDFYRDLSPREDQVGALRAQFALAEDLGKPLVLHCRDAFSELHDEVESAGVGPRSVLHCWTGGPRWTQRFAALGVTFSFAGPLAYPTGDTARRAAAVAPPERTMIETDTPYLTPPPHREAPNEPANVVAVGEALAGVWGVAPAEVARLTAETAHRVFRGD